MDTKREGISETEFFGNGGEGSHVTDLGAAVLFRAGAGKDASEILDVFHGAHEVTKVRAVVLVTGYVDKILIGGNSAATVSVASMKPKEVVKIMSKPLRARERVTCSESTPSATFST